MRLRVRRELPGEPGGLGGGRQQPRFSQRHAATVEPDTTVKAQRQRGDGARGHGDARWAVCAARPVCAAGAAGHRCLGVKLE